MGKHDILTKYIDTIQTDRIGDWVFDRENDGTPENPIHMPYVNYSEVILAFVQDVYKFSENNKDMELTCYGDILNKNGIEWDTESMRNAVVSEMNAQCVLATIMGAVRAERFCDGALLDFFENGDILKWLKRLKEIDGGDLSDQ